MPKAWLEAINEFQNQERGIEYVTLGPAQAGDIAEPTADELSKYFEARKILLFRGGIFLDRMGEVDRRRVLRHAHGIDGEGPRPAKDEKQESDQISG